MMEPDDSTTDQNSNASDCDPAVSIATGRTDLNGVLTWTRNKDQGCGKHGWVPDGGKADETKSFGRWANFDGARLWPNGFWFKERYGERLDERDVDLAGYEVTACRDDAALTYYGRQRDYGVSGLPVFPPIVADPPDEESAAEPPGDTDDESSTEDERGYETVPKDQISVRLALYAEAMHGWRQLTDVRFRLLSMLPAISIVAFIPLLLVVSSGNPAITAVGTLLAVLGLGVTHGLHIYDHRNDGLYNDLISRAKRIEAEWGVDTGVMLGRLKGQSNRVSHGRGTFWVYRCVKLAWLTVAATLAISTLYLTAEAWIIDSDDEPASVVVDRSDGGIDIRIGGTEPATRSNPSPSEEDSDG